MSPSESSPKLNATEAILGLGESHSVERTRVLLVEDDVFDRSALRRYIAGQNLDYDLTEAGSLAEARHLLDVQEFDVLLLDHRLPDGEGATLLPHTAPTPVILVTGVSDLALAVEAMRQGASDFLVKDTARAYLKLLPISITRVVREFRTRSRLNRSQNLFRQVFAEGPVGKMLARPDGRLVQVNRAACELNGYEEQELLDQGLQQVLSPAHFAAWSKGLEDLRERRLSSWEVEYPSRHKSGRILHIRYFASLVWDEQDAPVACVIQLVDLTETRNAEKALRVSEAQLSHARKLEAIGTLAGGIAHEFNNLLTAIMGNLQLTEFELEEGHAARPMIDTALESCRRSRDLVNRILTFSRDARKEQIPVKLTDLVADAARLLQTRMPPHVVVECEIDDTCPAIAAHVGEITEAILQLGFNARDAMEPEGGRLRITLQHGDVPPGLLNQYPELKPEHAVCLSVQDTGVGIAPEHLGRIFEPFYTTKEPGRGSGLGLAGVHGIMKRHRGTVLVESKPGSGTTVRLYFPTASTPGTLVG